MLFYVILKWLYCIKTPYVGHTVLEEPTVAILCWENLRRLYCAGGGWRGYSVLEVFQKCAHLIFLDWIFDDYVMLVGNGGCIVT